ncbi:Kv channel-interacting protein 4 [Halotydeus destructor]|nr:Kv channel-interacting protein 4 [Halotydeus destructor]
MLSSLSRGSPVEKLRWIFNLYDIQATGYVTRPEMIQIVSSIYDMLGHCTKPKVDDSCAQAHVDTVFNQMDTNQDGVITFDEFCDWCQKDPGRSQNLAMFDTVFL